MVSIEPQRTHMSFDDLGDVFGALSSEAVAREVERRQCPDGRKYIRGRTEGYSCTYLHLGRKAAMSMIAPEACRALPLKSASVMELSMVTVSLSYG